MEIKTLTRDYIAQIIELERHNAPKKPLYSKYDLEALEFLFQNPETCGALGVFDGKELVGWGAYRTNWKRHGKEVGVREVSSIVIDKHHRRKGLGGKVLDKILGILKSKAGPQ